MGSTTSRMLLKGALCQHAAGEVQPVLQAIAASCQHHHQLSGLVGAVRAGCLPFSTAASSAGGERASSSSNGLPQTPDRSRDCSTTPQIAEEGGAGVGLLSAGEMEAPVSGVSMTASSSSSVADGGSLRGAMPPAAPHGDRMGVGIPMGTHSSRQPQRTAPTLSRVTSQRGVTSSSKSPEPQHQQPGQGAKQQQQLVGAGRGRGWHFEIMCISRGFCLCMDWDPCVHCQQLC